MDIAILLTLCAILCILMRISMLLYDLKELCKIIVYESDGGEIPEDFKRILRRLYEQ